MLAFLRVVELLPPLFRGTGRDHLAMEEEVNRFLEGARSIRDFADVILVASVKDPRMIKVSAVEAAAMLQELLRVEAAPVIVLRDQNRPAFKSSVLTCIALGLKSVMIAWGDDYPQSAGAANVRDFRSLAQAIREAAEVRRRSHSSMLFFAPVDVDSLAYPRGVALAKERLRSGADLLLAQPPTTDAESTFDRHASLLEDAGIKTKTLLNVFPFKDAKDAEYYEKIFGWRLPRELHAAAKKGEANLMQLEKSTIRRLRTEGFPGVYITTRGTPRVAETLLS